MCELELPAPPAVRHGEPRPRCVRPGTRPAVEPAGPRRPRTGVVEVLPLRAAAGPRGRRRLLHLRRGLRVPTAAPPPRPRGRRQRAALRRCLPRHHHQEGLGVQGPRARPPARPQRPQAHLPLPHRHADHPQRRGGGGARPRLAGRPLPGLRHLNPQREDHGQGWRCSHDVPLQRAVRVGAGGDDPAQAGEAGHPHRQQLHHGRGGRRPAEGRRRRARRLRDVGAVGAERVREPGGPHQRGVRGVLRPPQEDGGHRRGRRREAGDEELGEGPAAGHRQGGRLRATAPLPVGRPGGEPRPVAGLQGGARDPPVVEARPGAGVQHSSLRLIIELGWKLELRKSEFFKLKPTCVSWRTLEPQCICMNAEDKMWGFQFNKMWEFQFKSSFRTH